MECELEEYVDYAESSGSHEQFTKTNTVNTELFPELWEIELETLQIENNSEIVNRVSENEISRKTEPFLEDYIDSENEVEKNTFEQPDLCANEISFPPMWELELEIYNCDSLSSNDNRRDYKGLEKLIDSGMECIVSDNSAPAVQNSQPLIKNDTFIDNDINLAESMFHNLMLSSSWQIPKNELIDIPHNLESLKLN